MTVRSISRRVQPCTPTWWAVAAYSAATAALLLERAAGDELSADPGGGQQFGVSPTRLCGTRPGAGRGDDPLHPPGDRVVGGQQYWGWGWGGRVGGQQAGDPSW